MGAQSHGSVRTQTARLPKVLTSAVFVFRRKIFYFANKGGDHRRIFLTPIPSFETKSNDEEKY
jgi:hypothetical protein